MEFKLTSSQFMKEAAFPFWIRRYFHDHANTPSAHRHDFIELVYIVYGEAEHVFEGECYNIRAGDVFIINPDEVHAYRIEPGKRLEIINCLFLPELIQESWLRELGISQSMDYFYVHPFLNTTERFHHRLNLRGQDASRTLVLLEGMIQENDRRQSGYSTLIRIQLVELLILLSRYYGQQDVMSGPKPQRESEHQLIVRRISGYLERYYDKKVSVPSICELFNVSTRQVNRIFKKETGMTVIEAAHHIRIDKAKILLEETDEKVITIAGKVGYDDPAFFSRLFQRLVGCSPGKYREHHLPARTGGHHSPT
ncbi:HTH-type transcriptional activator RhaR [Paenibacillus solanacearum]|uniref:HTH-type transcriptional activator RhaR n=1 Tax=Paenibacillus solanacearum TaxID=2048548 RepID=A0A916JTK4_9BACL|nr:AraC family transcriptional regulator [Paenibacillus solanacearum]CAG7597870.1 HTH-type transcriptional activator RhaR [Paenibacillus solanacearum]